MLCGGANPQQRAFKSSDEGRNRRAPKDTAWCAGKVLPWWAFLQQSLGLCLEYIVCGPVRGPQKSHGQMQLDSPVLHYRRSIDRREEVVWSLQASIYMYIVVPVHALLDDKGEGGWVVSE